MDIEDRLRRVLGSLTSAEPPRDTIDRATRNLPPRRNSRFGALVATGAGIAVLGVVVGVAVVSAPQAVAPGTSMAPTSTSGGLVASVPTEAPSPTPGASGSQPAALATTSPSATSSYTGMTELERSDLFWDGLISGEGPDEIDSLAGGLAEADLVVTGHFTGFTSGSVGGYAVTRATFAVDDVLKGVPQSPTAGVVTLQFMPHASRDTLEALMPSHRHLLFLFYVPAYLDRQGVPPEGQQDEQYDYILMHGAQAVIREISGTARGILESNDDRFPSSYDGQLFAALVLQVERIASGLETPVPVR